MDIAYLTGQRLSDVLKMVRRDIKDGALEVRQGKTKKFLRILRHANGIESELNQVITRSLARKRKLSSIYIITASSGQPLNRWTLRSRFDAARDSAIKQAESDAQLDLAERIKQFQFRDIRSKAASDISNLGDASRLSGHTEQQITDKVYRRLGETIKPTR